MAQNIFAREKLEQLQKLKKNKKKKFSSLKKKDDNAASKLAQEESFKILQGDSGSIHTPSKKTPKLSPARESKKTVNTRSKKKRYP